MKRNTFIIILIFVIFVISFFMINVFSNRSEAYLNDYTFSKINNIISMMINNIISGFEKKDLILIEKNSDNEVVNLNIDNFSVNEYLFYINKKILEDIDSAENNDFFHNIYYVPYNVVFRNNLFVNLGPRIPFKVEFLGNLNNSTSTLVSEYGINSYIVEVVLNINIEFQVIIPFRNKNYSVDKKIVLESKIIHGETPKYYGSSK